MRVAALTLLTACGSATSMMPPAEAPDAGAAPSPDAPPAAACTTVDDSAPVAIATATTADDYALVVTAATASKTDWSTTDNQAVVLEVAGSTHGFIGHLVLHQGQATFDYAMHAGALDAGEQVTVKVSPLSAPQAVRKACVTGALTPGAQLGDAAEGLAHAPIFRWPVQKSFNDIPVVVGWSKARKAYQTVMTNEDGGTTEQCGGGATGIQSEIARWGRASDIEGHYGYAAAAPTWERCTGTVPVTTTALRMENAHPILYWGDGHNRVFESRAGYGQTCGTGLPEKPDGDFAGWNVSDPDTSLAGDAGNVIVLRPLPVDMDALGYAQFGGRREGLADHYAPWVYRLTALELSRENKVDNNKSLTMSRYLYVDVRVADVGGSGDQYCAPLGVSGGFKLRAVTHAGVQIDSAQITADYASGGAHDWKRVAIPLPDGTTAADIDHFVFDAYDDDGIYLTGIGDAFIPQASGDNNATLTYVRQGEKDLLYYVDDDSSSCSGGVNTGGPGGKAYACTGSFVSVAL